MFLDKVISYGNAWRYMQENNLDELNELMELIPTFLSVYSARSDAFSTVNSRQVGNRALEEKGWKLVGRIYRSSAESLISLRDIGYIKNGISVVSPIATSNFISRWIFSKSYIAAKLGLIKIPILVLPTEDFIKHSSERPYTFFSIDAAMRQLEPLIPLNHPYPFLIFGITNRAGLFDTSVVEIESNLTIEEKDRIVDRSIEFPSEFYQAGLNILSFFGTYLRQQYPKEEAKVKIEQDGRIVRLIIESRNGSREVIEKALEDYQLVVSGQRRVEEVTDNQFLILELKTELRMAHARIENQRDIIELQQSSIDNLNNIISNALSTRQPISIDFKPNISISQRTDVGPQLIQLATDLGKLRKVLPSTSKSTKELKEIEGALLTLQEEDPQKVQSSSVMKRLRSFLEESQDGSSKLSKTLTNIEGAFETCKELAGKYNSIAQWVGLPQVPTIFTK